MQELGKLKFTINIPNGLEKNISFNINNKLVFIDSFQFLSSPLDSLVKHLSKDDFNYLSQEFDNNILYLVEQQKFYPYKYMSGLENFEKRLPLKGKFYSSLTVKKNSDKNHEHNIKVWNAF